MTCALIAQGFTPIKIDATLKTSLEICETISLESFEHLNLTMFWFRQCAPTFLRADHQSWCMVDQNASLGLCTVEIIFVMQSVKRFVSEQILGFNGVVESLLCHLAGSFLNVFFNEIFLLGVDGSVLFGAFRKRDQVLRSHWRFIRVSVFFGDCYGLRVEIIIKFINK